MSTDVQRVIAGELVRTVSKYTLFNPTSKWIEFSFEGETRRVPPYNEVAFPHPKAATDPGFRDVPHSAQYADGKFIPGTLEIWDLNRNPWTPNSMFGGDGGQGSQPWSAIQAIIQTLGIPVDSRGETSGEMTSKYSERGLCLLPKNPTRELVEQIAETGRAKWKKFQEECAQHTVESYKAQADSFKVKGLNPPPPGDDYYEALAILEAVNERRKSAYQALHAKAEKFDGEPENEAPAEDPELEKFVAEMAERIERKAGLKPGEGFQFLTEADLEAIRAKAGKPKKG